MKSYSKGRKAVLAVVRKSKFRQILRKVYLVLFKFLCLEAYLDSLSLFQDLESRPMKKTVPIGLPYHIHDIIGAELVTW